MHELQKLIDFLNDKRIYVELSKMKISKQFLDILVQWADVCMWECVFMKIEKSLSNNFSR